MAPVRKTEYQSYLLRCWMLVDGETDTAMPKRFTVESICDEPEQWTFSTFDEMVNFLHGEVMPTGRSSAAPPPQDADGEAHDIQFDGTTAS